jgi:integrase
MSRIKLKYVHQFVDKRNGAAKPRYYFRRDGKRVPLLGLPGSPEFMAAYTRALEGTPPPAPIGTKRVKPGSIAHVIALYLASAKFTSRRQSTQRTYFNILERFRRDHGDKPVADLERKHIEAMLAAKVATPAAANHWLRLVKVLVSLAVREGMRSDNPVADVDRLDVPSDGFHTWTEAEIAQFEQFHPIGSKPRLAMALLLYTAQRRSDVVKMGRRHLRGDVVDVRQQKTGKYISIGMHPELARILTATPAAITPTFLMTAYGKPFTAAGFGGWFREQCDKAGLPKECTAHGLRKAACRRLAEAGCSASVIASISGHTSLREVERYVKAADQERMARIGIAAIANVGRTAIGNGE